MTAVSPGPSNPMYRALPPVRIESIDAWVTRSKTYTLPSTSVLTYTCALSGVTATSSSAHEVYPASFVRDHRCHARRVEPDETRAAASCHLPDERTRAEVKHVEFAVGERADVHLRVVWRHGDIERVAGLRRADRVRRIRRAIGGEIANEQPAIADVRGEEELAVAGDRQLLDIAAGDSLTPDHRVRP